MSRGRWEVLYNKIKANITFIGGEFEQLHQPVNMKVHFCIFKLLKCPHLNKHNKKKRFHWFNFWAQVTGQFKLVSDCLKDKGSPAVTKLRSDTKSVWQWFPQMLWMFLCVLRVPCFKNKHCCCYPTIFNSSCFFSLVDYKQFCPPVRIWHIALGCTVRLATCLWWASYLGN